MLVKGGILEIKLYKDSVPEFISEEIGEDDIVSLLNYTDFDKISVELFQRELPIPDNIKLLIIDDLLSLAYIVRIVMDKYIVAIEKETSLIRNYYITKLIYLEDARNELQDRLNINET